jgi:hypothetical protein
MAQFGEGSQGMFDYWVTIYIYISAQGDDLFLFPDLSDQQVPGDMCPCKYK